MSLTVTLSAVQVRCFLHHLHIIPVSRGYSREWRERNAPGWETGTLVRALHAAGAIRRCSVERHFSGWAPVDDLVEVTLERPGFDWFPDLVPDKPPGVVLGPKYCQTCGRSSAVVSFTGHVGCGDHRATTTSADLPNYDWRTGERLPTRA